MLAFLASAKFQPELICLTHFILLLVGVESSRSPRFENSWALFEACPAAVELFFKGRIFLLLTTAIDEVGEIVEHSACLVKLKF